MNQIIGLCWLAWIIIIGPIVVPSSHTIFAWQLITILQICIASSVGLLVCLLRIFSVLMHTFRPWILILGIESTGILHIGWYHLSLVFVEFNWFTYKILFHILNNLFIEIKVSVFILFIGCRLVKSSPWSLFPFSLLLLLYISIIILSILIDITCFFGMTSNLC